MRRSVVVVGVVVVVVAVLAACGGPPSEVTVLAVEPKKTVLVTSVAADDRGVAWVAFPKKMESQTLKLLAPGGKPVVIHHKYVFDIALDYDAVYWSDGSYIWRSPRDKAEPTRIAEVDDPTQGLVIDGGFLYWATGATISKVGRIPLAGGVSEIITAESPADDGAPIYDLAVAGPHIIVAVNGVKQAELWELGSEPRRIAQHPGTPQRLLIDGDTILWEVSGRKRNQVLSIGFDGTHGPIVRGSLVAAHGGTIYVRRGKGADDATYAVTLNGERRVGPPMADGVIVGSKLFGEFWGRVETQIGYVMLDPK